MTPQAEVLIPIGEIPDRRATALSPRVASLRGKSIAIFYNSWQCMVTMADELKTLLTSPGIGAREVTLYASPATLAMPEATMREAIARSDAAIVGLGT